LSEINDKIDEMKSYLSNLLSKVPDTFNEYESDDFLKRGCERYVEIIIEGITDISFMIISKKKFKTPEDDIDSFRILADNKIIREELFKKLKEAKGMRNILAHQYAEVDDKIVYDSIKNELEKDVNRFIKEVKKVFINQ